MLVFADNADQPVIDSSEGSDLFDLLGGVSLGSLGFVRTKPARQVAGWSILCWSIGDLLLFYHPELKLLLQAAFEAAKLACMPKVPAWMP